MQPGIIEEYEFASRGQTTLFPFKPQIFPAALVRQ